MTVGYCVYYFRGSVIPRSERPTLYSSIGRTRAWRHVTQPLFNIISSQFIHLPLRNIWSIHPSPTLSLAPLLLLLLPRARLAAPVVAPAPPPAPSDEPTGAISTMKSVGP
jgi:hypothetical protein